MRKLAFLACLMPICANAAETELTGDKLREAVSGKTVYILSPLGEIPIRYAANGFMSGTTELALLDGESHTSDQGKWWVENDKLCIRWNKWMNRKQHCFKMTKAGRSTVRWRRDDGKSGLARLSS